MTLSSDCSTAVRPQAYRTYRPQENVREVVPGEMLVPLLEPAEDTCSQRTSGELGTKRWSVGCANHLPALQAKS